MRISDWSSDVCSSDLAEMGVSIRITAGPAIERTGDLASVLTTLQTGDILFIDEVHRLPRVVEETLYPAMEDFSLDIILGSGPQDRKSVVLGKGVSGRVDPGWCRIITKKKKKKN